MIKLFIFLLIGLTSVPAKAAPWDIRLMQKDLANLTYIARDLALPPSNAVFGLNAATSLPQYFLLGTTLSYSSGFLNVATVPSTSITGLATVAMSGNYNDLSGAPTPIPGPAGATGPTGPSGTNGTNGTNGTDATVKFYEGTNLRSGAIGISKSATVSSGVAVFHLTSDGLSTGTALFPNGVIVDSVNAFVSDATASYQMSYAFSNSNKTLTVTANKLTTANILTGLLGQTQANGSVVKVTVWGY